jgi:RimJ/RimL family protein N-acetyltransferase
MLHPFLVGENIYLRAIEESDLEKYMDWLNDADTCKYLQHGVHPANLDGMKNYLKSLQARGGDLFAIIKKAGCTENTREPLRVEKHIGNILFEAPHPQFRFSDIGILIGAKEERGKGYGTEAIRLLVDHGFRKMNLNRIEAGMVKENIGSYKAFKKAGFIDEGISRGMYYCDGEYRDVYRLAILKDDWRKER